SSSESSLLLLLLLMRPTTTVDAGGVAALSLPVLVADSATAGPADNLARFRAVREPEPEPEPEPGPELGPEPRLFSGFFLFWPAVFPLAAGSVVRPLCFGLLLRP